MVILLTIEVACPHRGSQAGDLCSRPSGDVYATRSGHPLHHRARVKAATALRLARAQGRQA